MLKFINADKRNFSKNLKSILNSRKSKQKAESTSVKKILLDVKKNGDKSIIKYEKKFSKIKSSSNKLKFLPKEIDEISSNIKNTISSSENIDYQLNKHDIEKLEILIKRISL